jgi:uncharacterized SAM-binding protein YcdF (DUF218 family)
MESSAAKLIRWYALLCTVLAALFFAGAVFFLLSLEHVVLRKFVKALVTPVGLLWIFLWTTCIRSWLGEQRTLGVALTGIALAYSLAGNSPLGALAVDWLQRDYIDVDPFQLGYFDAVIVLGGGTSTAPNGQPQVGRSGDRVLLAARLYHRARTPLLAATGERISYFSPAAPTFAEETAVLWADLGVSREHILKLGGRNTGEEMAQIQQLVIMKGWTRVGLVTSAWHMPRAMKEAYSQKVELVPLPASFTTDSRRWTWLSLIPSANGFGNMGRAFHEWLAMAAGG